MAQARDDDREGAFSASLDADSEGEEGKFYVWSLAEVMQNLGAEDGAFFARHYDVTPEGNFEGHNILNRLKPRRAARRRSTADGVARQTARRPRQRVRPGLDDKVLADWNGLMIAALANAGLMFDEPSWLERAARAFAFIASAMTRGDRLGHSWRQGQLKFPGLASDFAAMIRAALALYEATGRQTYLDQALAWQRALDRDYANADTGTYYLTAADAEGLVIRPAATADEATPNHNAVAAQNLIRLAVLAGDDRWRDKADRLIAAIAPQPSKISTCTWRCSTPSICGCAPQKSSSPGRGPALKRSSPPRAQCRPSTALCSTRPQPTRCRPHPARQKADAASGPQAFICVGETCSLPVTDPAGLIGAIEAMRHT